MGAPFVSLAAAAVVVVAAVVGVHAAVTAVAEEEDQDDDPPQIVAAEAVADAVMIAAHNITSERKIFELRRSFHVIPEW